MKDLHPLLFFPALGLGLGLLVSTFGAGAYALVLDLDFPWMAFFILLVVIAAPVTGLGVLFTLEDLDG
jgi:hypothetical protein